jgi:uncharacterized membrane protein YdfJ with MMPL/SSD domain
MSRTPCRWAAAARPPAISHRSTPSNVTFRLLSPIGPSAPLGILFGLLMDYEVFLLSRIREEWDTHHDNERAVAYRLEHTGASSRRRRSS